MILSKGRNKKVGEAGLGEGDQVNSYASYARDDYTWKMGGGAGTGIKNSALLLAGALNKGGYYVHANVEYPSRVRLGNNVLEVRMSTRPVRSLTSRVNLLAALDQTAVDMWIDEVVAGGVLVADLSGINLGRYQKRLKQKNIQVVDLPIDQILKKAEAPSIMRNTAVLGAIVGLICFDLDYLLTSLKEIFKSKGAAIVRGNVAVARAGYRYINKNYSHQFTCPPKATKKRRLLVEGSDAVILGALRAGLTSYSGYPMTPTSGLLRRGAALKDEQEVFVYQPEDEIAAAQFAIGAAHAGARSMTATSGGGFCLMSESLGLAAMTETPLVVVLGQRPGPSTGLPTRTGQGDLRFALHAGQDEPPRVVLAPGDPKEAFELTFHAFNIAEKYQLIVIILADKYLLESSWTHDQWPHRGLKIDRGKILTRAQAQKQKKYLRHKFTADGVSPRVLPGTPGLQNIWRTSSDEHTEAGFIEESIQNRNQMMAKRAQKVVSAYDGYLKKIGLIKVYGNPKARRAVVSFGSNKGVLLDALERLKKPSHKLIMIRCVKPFPVKEFMEAMRGVKNFGVVEGNQDGLLEGLIREKTGYVAEQHLRFVGGRPLKLGAVLNFLNSQSRKIVNLTKRRVFYGR